MRFVKRTQIDAFPAEEDGSVKDRLGDVLFVRKGDWVVYDGPNGDPQRVMSHNELVAEWEPGDAEARELLAKIARGSRAEVAVVRFEDAHGREIGMITRSGDEWVWVDFSAHGSPEVVDEGHSLSFNEALQAMEFGL